MASLRQLNRHIIRPYYGRFVVRHIGSAVEPIVGMSRTYQGARKIALKLEKSHSKA